MIEVLRSLAFVEAGILVVGTLLFFRQWTRQRSKLLKVRIIALAGFAFQQMFIQVNQLHNKTHWYGLPLTFLFTTMAIVGLFGPLSLTGWKVRPLREMKSYDALYRESQNLPED